jgi:hypothetical protein
MIWKDFFFGAAATLSAELVLTLVILGIALWKSERAVKKLRVKKRDD